MSKFLIALAFTLSLLVLLLSLKLSNLDNLPQVRAQETIDYQCIGEGVAKYMNEIIDGAGNLSNIKLLSPAFNMTSRHFTGIIDAMKASNANFNGLDAIAGNAYNFGGNRITQYAESAMASLPDLPLLLTETGKIDFGINELKSELAKIQTGQSGGVTYLGGLLFNAFNTNPGWSGFALSDSEIDTACSGSCGNIGVNYATSWGDLNANNFQRAEGHQMQFALAIVGNDVDSVSVRINSMPASITPVLRIGVGKDSGGFDNPQVYIDFLKALDGKVDRVVYAIAGPNEPESEPWATPNCKNTETPEKSATCNQVKDPEYHTLRPYPADPCDVGIHETTFMCSNQFVAKETFKVTPGQGSCERRADGSRLCTYNMTSNVNTSVNLDDAFLPILGNTELVPNSEQKTGTLDSSQRVNNYVSWYLNGVLNLAEEETRTSYDELSEEFLNKLINYSGPINKLMPWSIQARQKIKQIDNADKSRNRPNEPNESPRHDQIVGCVVGSIIGAALPANCLEIGGRGDAFKERLTDWLPFKPPFLEEIGNLQEYIKQYNEWRGSGCITVFGILLCTNAQRSNFYSQLFPAIPYSSTEDRKGTQETRDPPASVTTGTADDEVKVTNITYTPASKGEKEILYFAHAQEVAENSAFLQKTFAPQGESGDTNTVFESESPTIGPGCTILETRTNPGDDLHAEDTKEEGPIKGTLTYTASFKCVFPGPNISCITDCVEDGNTVDQCAEQCDTSTCTKDVFVGIPMEGQTPKVEEIWNRLVEGDFAVFKRIFPKIGPGSPLDKLKDIPAVTRGSYSASGGSSGSTVKALAGDPGQNKDGASAEIYFPHIGALKEYFLNGIQNALRPKGFAEEPLSGVLPPGTSTGTVTPGDLPGGPASLGNGSCNVIEGDKPYCSVGFLTQYFGPQDARIASRICNAESVGGDPFATNKKFPDYSIGLFQINLLAHYVVVPSSVNGVPQPDAGTRLNCYEGFANRRVSNTVSDKALVDRCEQIMLDPIQNIKKAVELKKGRGGWGDWSTYNTLAQCRLP